MDVAWADLDLSLSRSRMGLAHEQGSLSMAKRSSFEGRASGDNSQDSSLRAFSRAGSDDRSRKIGPFVRALSDESRRSGAKGSLTSANASEIKSLRKKQQIQQVTTGITLLILVGSKRMFADMPLPFKHRGNRSELLGNQTCS